MIFPHINLQHARYMRCMLFIVDVLNVRIFFDYILYAYSLLYKMLFQYDVWDNTIVLFLVIDNVVVTLWS
jgi:hypothetical protein